MRLILTSEGGASERNIAVNDINISDNGGRRKNGDRRNFTYTIYIPERRHECDRRSGEDRRKENRSSDKSWPASCGNEIPRKLNLKKPDRTTDSIRLCLRFSLVGPNSPQLLQYVHHSDNLFFAKLPKPMRPIPNNTMLMGSDNERPMVSAVWVMPAVALTQNSNIEANPNT